jgi:hypothetical protein
MWLTMSGAGVTGPGPWSRVRADRGPVSIEYDRSLHLGATTRLVVTLDCDRPGTVEIGLAGDHVEAFEVATAVPRPAAESIGPRERRLSFAVSEPGVVRLELQVVPRRSGRQVTHLRVDTAALDPIRQFVFP